MLSMSDSGEAIQARFAKYGSKNDLTGYRNGF